MRSLLARLFFVALAGGVVAGCSIAGSSQSNGSLPNGNGGGSVVTTNNPGASTKTAPPLYANPVQIDNGTEETPSPVPSGSKSTPGPVQNVYKAILGSTSTDKDLTGGVGPSPYPTGGPSSAPTTTSPLNALVDAGTDCVQAEGCTAEPVVLCQVPGMGHEIWSSAPTVVWHFFSSL